MNSPKRINYAMIVLNSLLIILIIGVVYLGDKALKKHSDALIENKLEVSLLENQQEELIKDRKDIEEYSELSEIVKQVVPQEKDPAITTREIVKLAQNAGVSIGAITFPTSKLGTKAAKPTDTISQVEPVEGTNGLLSLDINVVSDSSNPSSYGQLIEFLQNLENNRRTAQVSQISIQPDPEDSSLLTFTLTLKVYIKP